MHKTFVDDMKSIATYGFPYEMMKILVVDNCSRETYDILPTFQLDGLILAWGGLEHLVEKPGM